MSQLKIEQINQEVVKPVKFINEDEDKRPVAGANLFPEIYANIFLCARKKSGKSCVIYKTIEDCATSETRVIAFVSTLLRDPTWAAIEDLCKKKKVKFTGFTSIKDPSTGEDILDGIVHMLEDTPEEKPANKIPSMPVFGLGLKPDKEKDKRPKEKAPKIIFIFDDLSQEISSPSLTALMKKNRQFRTKIVIASQNWNDLQLQARKQIDYILLWPGFKQSLGKLEEIYRNADLSIPLDLFINLYRFCTRQLHHFMWIDVVHSEFRKDFSHKIVIPKEGDNEEEPEAASRAEGAEDEEASLGENKFI